MILDGNKLAEGQAFMAIGDTDISDNGNILAYSVDHTGFRQYTLHVKDLTTGEVLADEVSQQVQRGLAGGVAALYPALS